MSKIRPFYYLRKGHLIKRASVLINLHFILATVITQNHCLS